MSMVKRSYVRPTTSSIFCTYMVNSLEKTSRKRRKTELMMKKPPFVLVLLSSTLTQYLMKLNLYSSLAQRRVPDGELLLSVLMEMQQLHKLF
jgi:hypothetical protein